jgi:hypothetical protein
MTALELARIILGLEGERRDLRAAAIIEAWLATQLRVMGARSPSTCPNCGGEGVVHAPGFGKVMCHHCQGEGTKRASS